MCNEIEINFVSFDAYMYGCDSMHTITVKGEVWQMHLCVDLL